jgi:putative flippase GtrA
VAVSALGALTQRTAVRQFVKFCIVGFSSLTIDFLISYSLVFFAGFNPTLAKAISFMVSVTNGFFWNSQWTFRGLGDSARHTMYMRFVGINIVGFCLNILLFKSVLYLFVGRFIGQGTPKKYEFVIATLTAAVCVAFWNFLANRKWTFTPPQVEA